MTTTSPTPSSQTRVLPRAAMERLRDELVQALTVQTARSEESDADDIYLALQSQTSHAVVRIRSALERMDNGTYGICVSCSKPIPFERLEAVPYTPTCAHCASEQSRNGSSR